MSNEKKMDINDLIDQSKYEQGVTSSDIMKALEDIDYDIEQMEKLYENLESNEEGISEDIVLRKAMQVIKDNAVVTTAAPAAEENA